MARIPRAVLVFEGATNHCTWRAHDHERVFERVAGARQRFLALVAKYKDKFGIVVRSYCLMGTHPHMTTFSPRGQKAFSAFWQVVNSCFGRWYNAQCDRSGQVVMERLASPIIQDGRHALVVMRYGDLNPVRAGLVKSPKDWPWSSYRHYAFGEPNPLIDDAPEYLALGKNAVERRKAYQALFAGKIPSEPVDATQDLVTGPFIGDERWLASQYARTGLSPPRARAGPFART